MSDGIKIDMKELSFPLCVDLDGTLVHSDTLHENLLLMAKASPWSLAIASKWLLKGKSEFKHLVADRVKIDASLLPYRSEVIIQIEAARAAGRRVVLVTAACESIAKSVADYLGLFDELLCSNAGVNLSSHAKANALVGRFGEKGFDYIGNSKDDLAVFVHARRNTLISSSSRLRKSASSIAEVAFVDDGDGGLKAWRQALRLHQWLKNFLVFVPLFASHGIGDLQLLMAAILAFFSFSLCASAVYLLNDLLDLPSDRKHPRKKNRPFAAGILSAKAGVIIIPLLVILSVLISLLLPPLFFVVLVCYFSLTIVYSFWLKKQVIVDVMLLAGLYSLRVIAGAAATAIVPSFWLLALSTFAFLSLAFVKRYSELRNTIGLPSGLAGRGYLPDDLPVVLALGTSSGMISVLILAVYTQAEIIPSKYPTPEWLWLAPLLMLYWTARIWMKTVRGEVDDDPVLFAARDWQSLIVAVLMGGAFVLASTHLAPWN